MKLKILDSGTPDYESKLDQARTESQINRFLLELKDVISNCQNANEKINLQYIRQCAYNKKKKIIKEGARNGIQNHSFDNRSRVDSVAEVKQEKRLEARYPSDVKERNEYAQSDTRINRMHADSSDDKFRLPTSNDNIYNNKSGYISNNNYSKNDQKNIPISQWLIIVKNAAPVALYSLCALTSLTFVYMQSVPLYASSGFSNPELCAFGALLMIVGFSLIHAINKSKLALILCLYASAYEVTLIVQGTIKNENAIVSTLVSTNPRITFLQEQVAKEYSNYNLYKSRYEDPQSTVFQNSWFKTKQLDPSWATYASAQKELDSQTSTVNAKVASNNNGGLLKISYRLGLVFLCMISIHNLIKVTIKEK